ncbi:MAG: DUF4345 domain-containing protein, partial [Micromonosporaceae bacterium]|nr:DUF4345 domain-containing protein [Micromonosporaceae bacterium]
MPADDEPPVGGDTTVDGDTTGDPAGGAGTGSRRALQGLLVAFGLIAVGTGIAEIAIGGALVSQGEPVPVDVDSNYRFFAVFWLGAGLTLLWTVPRVERAAGPLRAVAALVFLGGLARLLSIAMAGVPSPMFLGLLALELAAPP